mmetsp:Transcript_30693/g.73142  ORF Transcript_30693/g.73142 Transcript_30693/m.73142 type:complete len:292 (+) Transcript_30693:347-1222(+)
MAKTCAHSPAGKADTVCSALGRLKPSAKKQTKEKQETSASCRQVKGATSFSGTWRINFSQRHICTAKSAALPSSKTSPRLPMAPEMALGPTKSAVPTVARHTEPQVSWCMWRPSSKLSSGTSTMVKLPSSAPLEAEVYCRPTACITKPRKSHTESSAPAFIAVVEPDVDAGAALSSRLNSMNAASARAAIPKRRPMHKKLSMASPVASSVSSVLISTWLLPKSMVTTFSSMMPPLCDPMMTTMTMMSRNTVPNAVEDCTLELTCRSWPPQAWLMLSTNIAGQVGWCRAGTV